MSGAKDSKTCYRRTQVPTNLNPDTYCDPLGDDNVVATIKGVSNQQIWFTDMHFLCVEKLMCKETRQTL
jgi:hypothetical protein